MILIIVRGSMWNKEEINRIKFAYDFSNKNFYHYREFILSIISVTPQINDTAIMYRCMEEFPDFAIPRMTFFRYVKKIRAESGYVKEERRRYSITEESLPGVEAQVDFGQIKLKSM